MSSVAWFLGFIFALQAVRLVLAAVGFMEFEELEFDITVKLGLTSILFTAVCTIGAALLFGNSRTKDFLELEIDEGGRKVPTRKKPKTAIHVIMFLVGLVAVLEAWVEESTGESGFIENFFIDGLVGLFGPFLLLIGGWIMDVLFTLHLFKNSETILELIGNYVLLGCYFWTFIYATGCCCSGLFERENPRRINISIV